MRLAKRLSGRTGLVVEIRNPPLMLRGVLVRYSDWITSGWLAVSGGVEVEIGAWTFRPVALECAPGLANVQILDAKHRLVKSAVVQLDVGTVTLVTVFPPVDSLTRGRNVRSTSTIETRVLEPNVKRRGERVQ